MRITSIILYVFALCFVSVILMPLSAQAQASRTWVSGVGDDANPCSRTAPCQTFAGALPKTAAGGEISVLDPGSYGAVTLTKSISIVASGNVAGVLVNGANAITIAAGNSDTVFLDGLDIEGINTGLAGIKITNAAKVVVRNTTILDFANPSSPDSGSGIDVVSTSPLTLILERVNLSNNLHGIYANSSIAQTVYVNNSSIVNNSAGGVVMNGQSSRAYVSQSLIVGNSPDISRNRNAVIYNGGGNQLQSGSFSN